MARTAPNPLAEIQRDARNERLPIKYALRGCLDLGGLTGSADLREWASRELHGYFGNEDALPPYRRIRAPLLMDGISGNYKVTGESVSWIDLPNFARDDVSEEITLAQGIGEIEGMVSLADSKGGFLQMSPQMGADLARFMTHELGDPRRHVERIYWTVSASSLRGVVDAVRTRLIELAAEMRAGTPAGFAIPSPEVAEQAVQFVIKGKGNRVSYASAGDGGTAIVTSPTEPAESGFWTTSHRIGAAIVGAAGIAGAIAAILALHPRF